VAGKRPQPELLRVREEGQTCGKSKVTLQLKMERRAWGSFVNDRSRFWDGDPN
jgi:hypothetical protein